MMRALPILLIAAFLLVAATGPASADPLSGLLITALGLKGAAATIVGALFNLAASAALTLLGQKKQKESGVQISGTTAGEEPPQRTIIGRSATGGHLVYHNSHGTGGTPNEYYTMVIAVSALPGVSLRGLIVNDKRTALGEDLHPQFGAPMLRFRQGGDDYGWIRFYDGSQTTADADLVAAYGTDPDQPWTTDHIGTGFAYAVLTMRLNREVWNGVPTFRFILNGIPLYDPRKDSTVGGSGAHRWQVLSTYEPTENPIVMAYNVMRGIPTPDGDIYGGEDIEAADLPLSNLIAGMNVCDQDLGARKRFTAGLEFTLDTEPAAVVEELLKACLGQISEVGGIFRIRVAEPDAPVLSITDGDISISDPQQFNPFPGLEGTHNALRIAHPNAAALWQPVQTPVRRNAEWEAADGGRMLARELSVPACFNHGQAQALEAGYIADDRRFRTHQFVLPPDAQQLELLDVIELTSAANGYVDKLFEVAHATYLPGRLFVLLTIRERDPDDYDWNSEGELPPPPDLDPTPVDDRVIPTAEWAVAGDFIADGEGEPRRPALEVTWGAEVVRDARALRYQVRVADTNVLVAQGRVTPADGRAVVAEGILPATDYIARLRPVLDRPSEWTGWKPAATPDVRLGESDLDDDIREQLIELEGWIGAGIPGLLNLGDRLRDMRDRLRGLQSDVLDISSRQWLASEQIRRSITVQLNNRAASIEEVLTVVADESSAAAQLVLTLQARVDDAQAQIQSIQQVTVSALEALALQIATLEVDLTSLDGNLTGLASAVTTIEARVTATEEGIDIVASQYSDLVADLEDLESDLAAQATAFSGLEVRVTSNEEGLSAIASWITGVESTLDDLEAGISANASALTGLQTQVTSINGQISVLSAWRTLVEASLLGANSIPNGAFTTGNLAGWLSVPSTFGVIARGSNSASAVQNAPTPYILSISQSGTTQSATAVEGITVQPGDQFRAAFSRAAGGSSPSVTLEVRVSWWDATGAQVGGFSTAAGVTSGSLSWARVTGGIVTAPAGAATVRFDMRRVGGGAGTAYVADFRVERLSVDVAANASATSALQAQVTNIDGEVTAMADAVTSLSASSTPGNTNEANFRMQVLSGIDGYSRIGMQTRQGGAGSWRGASLFLDTPNNSALPTRIVATAEEFALTHGSNVRVPFSIRDGVVRISEAVVDRLSVLRGSLTDAFFVSQAAMFDGAVSWGSWVTVETAAFTLPTPAANVPDQVIIRPFVGFRQPVIVNNSGANGVKSVSYQYRLRLYRGGTNISNSDWALHPYWQAVYESGWPYGVTYGCVPEAIVFYVDTDALGALPGDSIRIQAQYRRDRSINDGAIPGFYVDSETLELQVEYYYR